ncbi:MAG: tetratricopeptide repeat protein [Pseudomonadota bacterium]
MRSACLLPWLVGSAVTWLALGVQAEVRVEVSAPAFTFKAGEVLDLDREAKLAAEEFELSQTLRPLLSDGDYAAAYQAIVAAPGTDRSAALELLAAQLQGVLGKYQQATVHYRAALKKMPQLTRAHAGLGTMYLLMEQPDAARASLAKAVSYGAQDVQTFAQLGYLNQTLGHPWSAINAYQQALMLEPDNAQWQFGLLSVMIAAGHLASATALIDELLTRKPADVRLWQQRANLAIKKDEPVTALASLETALRLGESNPANKLAAAQLHMQQGNFARAAGLLVENLEAAELSAVDAYPMILWLIDQGALREANTLIGAFKQRLDRLSPAQQSLVAELRGRYALAQARLPQAVEHLANAVRLDAGNARAMLRLARLYLQRGQAARAALMFERAETIPGNEKSALLGRAQVAIDRSDYAEALRLVRLIQKRFPGSYELDSYVRSLTSLQTTQNQSR